VSKRRELALVFSVLILSFLARLLTFDLTSQNILKSVAYIALVCFLVVRSARPQEVNLSFWSILGLALSFSAPLLFDYRLQEFGLVADAALWAALTFYSGVAIWAYIVIGRNFSLFPAAKGLSTTSLFAVVRHPMYSAYLHIAACFLAMNFSLRNSAAFLMFVTGLGLRIWQEEHVLKKNISAFNQFKVGTSNRLFALVLSAPFLVLASIVGIESLGNNKASKGTEIRIHVGYPISTLNPNHVEDWGALFVINMIMPKIVPDSLTQSSLNNDLEIVCDSQGPGEKCEYVNIIFGLRSIHDCEGKIVSTEQIQKELESMMSARPWILGTPGKCEANPKDKVCVRVRNRSDIRRRIQNAYFRFGWSKILEGESRGIGPYCLSTDFSNMNFPLKQGFLIAKSADAPFSKVLYGTFESGEYDLSLYDSPDSTSTYESQEFNTPIGYFVISNPDLPANCLPWRSDETRRLIWTHLRQVGLVQEGHVFENFLPQGTTSSKEHIKNCGPKQVELLLPDYIEGCEKLSDQLNKVWQGKARSLCGNTSALGEKLVAHQKVQWSAFLTPLSPGFASPNAIYEQYFDRKSQSSLLNKAQDPHEYFYLVGAATTRIQVKRSLVCGVAPSVLGLGDFSLENLQFCD
jgi:protein-S-isoprenylcysteine O-methyltransferase Ste14